MTSPMGAISDDIEINVNIKTTGADETEAQIGNITKVTREWSLENISLNNSIAKTSVNTRVMGRDLMSLAFGINFLARHMGVANPVLDAFLTTLMAVGVTMRTLSIIQTITAFLNDYTGAVSLATIAQWLYNAALWTTVNFMTILTGGAILVGAAVGLMALQGMVASSRNLPRMHSGGTVPSTGPYLLQKGETVFPAGPNYSWININMQTGPISSNIDVDNMLDDMSSRLVSQSRRRRGY